MNDISAWRHEMNENFLETLEREGRMPPTPQFLSPFAAFTNLWRVIWRLFHP